MLRHRIASLTLVLACVVPALACRESPRRDAGTAPAGHGKPGEVRARPRAAARPSTTPCEFGPLRSIGTQVRAGAQMSMGFVSGHLGAAWIGVEGVPRGSELRDNGAILRPIDAGENAPPHDALEVLWTRPFPVLDSRSALVASMDIERRVADTNAETENEAGSFVEVRCGEVIDTPLFVTHSGGGTPIPGSMFACRSVGDAMPFVIGLAAEPPDSNGGVSAVRVFARRNALPIATAWDADRISDPVWTIPVEPMAAGGATDFVRRWRETYEPASMTMVEAPGRGSLVTIALQGHLYFGWLDARLGAASPLHRIASATHVTGAAVGWNGYEALVVFADEEAGAARVFASRVSPRGGASAPVQIATTPAVLNAIRSPSVAAFGNGEWAVAWIEASRVSDNALPGFVRVQMVRTDLTPREPAHGWGGDQLDEVRVAARGEGVVIGVLAGSGDTGHVDVATARCASSGYVPPPVAPAVSQPVPPSARRVVPSSDGGAACTAYPHRSFRLRAAAARPGSGREFEPSVVSVLERGTVQRGDATIHRVRTTDGSTGWIFLSPGELSSSCATR